MNAGGIPSSSPAPSWVTSDASPWTSVGARTIDAPNAAAIDCIPRQTPSSGIAARAATSIVATETPASSGSPGPGRDRRSRAGPRPGRRPAPRRPARSIASLRTTRTSAPAACERLDEVEREAVVVVDDEDHRPRLPPRGSARPARRARRVRRRRPPARSPGAGRRPCARSPRTPSPAREPATIPAPVWTWAWPSRRTALRIVIAVSRLPS